MTHISANFVHFLTKVRSHAPPQAAPRSRAAAALRVRCEVVPSSNQPANASYLSLVSRRRTMVAP